MKWRRLFVLAVFALAVSTAELFAQIWPTKPVRAIVPFTPGSGTDVIARLVLDQLSTQLGQAVIVENRTGAGGTIGAAAVAKADPDGYTLLVHSSALTILPAIYPNLNYDTARDLLPVVPLGISPNVVVISPSKGHRTVQDLVAAAKAKPRSISFASAGVGTNTHLSAERFRLSAGFEAVHVPFKGGAEAITEVMAGRVDIFFSPIGIVLSHIREGTLLPLAVNSRSRAGALPDVPTTLEAGFAGSDYPIWWGLFSPTRTPRAVVDKLHLEALKALETPKVQEKRAMLGIEPMVMSQSEFDAHFKNEISVNTALVQATGVKAN
jgi:tripartite-type tricarboxylate transporter receptor subunit TctC